MSRLKARLPCIFLTLVLSVSAMLAQTSTSATASNAVPAPTSSSPARVILKAGTPVNLKLGQTLSSRTAKVGDSVEFVLDQDLQASDVVVVRKGARVLGTVLEVHKPGAVGKGGALDIQLDYLKAKTQHVKLRGDENGQEKRNTGAVIAKTIFFGLGGLLSQGKQSVISEGTPVVAYVDEDVELLPAR